MNTSLTSTNAPAKRENSTLYFEPRFTVHRGEDETRVRVELPGVAKDNLEMSVNNNELFLEGSVSQQRPESWKVLHRESVDRTYQLRLRLGDLIEKASIGASLEDGVLTLKLPRAESAKPRKIKVK